MGNSWLPIVCIVSVLVMFRPFQAPSVPQQNDASGANGSEDAQDGVGVDDSHFELWNRVKREFVYADPSKLWPNGTVPYEVDPELPAWLKDYIVEAVSRFHNMTCVRFIMRTNETDWLYITGNSTSGCSSRIGRSGKMQYLRLDTNGLPYSCGKQIGSIQHELMHAIGFSHEQQRKDRLFYVAINSSLIETINYALLNETELPCRYGYDFQSLMHYHLEDSTKMWLHPSAPVNKTEVQAGQRRGFSELDVLKIRLLYRCSEEDVCKPNDYSELLQRLEHTHAQVSANVTEEQRAEFSETMKTLREWTKKKIADSPSNETISLNNNSTMAPSKL